MTAAILGILPGPGIGAACRWIDIPLPAPPKLVGALLVVATTVGYVATVMVLTTGWHPKSSIVRKEKNYG